MHIPRDTWRLDFISCIQVIQTDLASMVKWICVECCNGVECFRGCVLNVECCSDREDWTATRGSAHSGITGVLCVFLLHLLSSVMNPEKLCDV